MKPIAAIALLCIYLPVPFFLLWMHFLNPLWRRTGAFSYIIHVPLYFAMVYLLIHYRSIWTLHSIGGHWSMTALGIILMAASAVIAIFTYGRMDAATIFLLHQISPGGRRKLITDGIYRSLRHPRYLMFMMIAAGNFFVTGYSLLLAALAATVIPMLLAAKLEEKELREYFGDAYQEYARRTPGFLPFLKGRRRS